MLLCHGFPCALLGPFLWGHILLLPCLIILHHGPSVSTCFPISPASAQGCLSSHTSPKLVYIENAHLQPEKSWRQQPPTLPSTLSLAPSIGLPHCLLTEACGLTCVCFSFANIRSPKFLGSSGSPGSGRTDTTILVGAQCSNTQSRGNRPPPPYWTQDSLTTGSLMTSSPWSRPLRGQRQDRKASKGQAVASFFEHRALAPPVQATWILETEWVLRSLHAPAPRCQ